MCQYCKVLVIKLLNVHVQVNAADVYVYVTGMLTRARVCAFAHYFVIMRARDFCFVSNAEYFRLLFVLFR